MAVPVVAPAPKTLDLKTQLFRFVLTGGLAAIVDFGTLLILTHLGLAEAGAKAVSFIFGTTTAYLINRRWTFQASPSRARFIAVVVLYAVTFALQVGIYLLLFNLLADSSMGTQVVRVMCFVAAQGVATTVNFLVQRTVIFKLRD